MPHTSLFLLWVADATSPALASLAAYLESIPHVQLTRVTQLPADPGDHDVVISRGGGGGPDLEGFVRNGGGWLALVDASSDPLHQLLGVRCDAPGSEAELRVLFQQADHLLLGEPIGAPLADSVKVVAILEAAARSMSRGGTREVIDGE